MAPRIWWTWCAVVGFLYVYPCASEVYKVPLERFYSEDPLSDVELTFSDTSGNSRNNSLGGRPGYGYYLTLEIGDPPQRLKFLVDTGSSNLAVACSPDPSIETYFIPQLSNSYESSDRPVYVPYTIGEWRGELGTDDVTVSSVGKSVRADIGCITSSKNFFINGSHWQGILGLGYAALARPDPSVTPLLDSLVDSGLVPNIFSLQLCASAPSRDTGLGGSLVLGGVDAALYHGPLLYTPLQQERYFEVVITDMELAGRSLALRCSQYNDDKTIVDSGTTSLRLPSPVYSALIARLKADLSEQLNATFAAGFYTGADELCWPAGSTPWYAFPLITLHLMATSNSSFALHLSPQQYMQSVEPSPEDPAESDAEDCFKLGIAPSSTGTVLGAVVMEGFYVVFDRAGKRIGFGQTTCPAREENVARSHVSGPRVNAAASYGDCSPAQKTKQGPELVVLVAYGLAAIGSLCILILASLLVYTFVYKHRRGTHDDTENLVQEDS